MDSLRGDFGSTDTALDGTALDSDVSDDNAAGESLPPKIGADERRMQVRAYNFWAGLLDDRNFPNVSDLDPELLPDFGPHGVLLDFSKGIEDPAVAFLGGKLAEECDAQDTTINVLSDVPTRSLLSRITDHYMQIIANQAPIGFEAEFVNQRGQTILYRGILLPFSSDDETIDFIFGVINWKEMADAQTVDQLSQEIDSALEANRDRALDAPMADWADGPGGDAGGDADAGFSIGQEDDDTGLPRPSFGLDLDAIDAGTTSFDLSTAKLPHDGLETSPEISAEIDQEMGLYDWLASARELALEARSNEDRTRNALYEAIGRAHDFALAAVDAPEEFAEMVEDAGLTVQARAPMTPVVKLVFGAEYDKTRLTEYASALSHAQRMDVARGDLAEFLRNADGGLKGVVKQERSLRREESGKAPVSSATGPRKAIARKLRAMEQRALDSIPAQGEEFALIMVRRTQNGGVVVLGEVPAETGMIEKAARKLLG